MKWRNLLWFIGFWASTAGAQFPTANPYGFSPHWEWKTIETEHFRVTFPSTLTELTPRVTELLEEAHLNLSPIFSWTPLSRTQVYLADNRDTANGLANPYGRFGILLWMVPSDNWQGISYYDDWLKLLIYHEYTHYLNIDITKGFWRTLRLAFGDQVFPNMAWSTWMKEGLATYIETQWTRAGRGRSPDYEALLRTAVHEGVLDSEGFITRDRLAGSYPYFPRGDVAYQFGYQLMNQLAHQEAPASGKVLGDLSVHGNVSIPYFYSTQLSEVIGLTWDQIWDQWIHATRIRMKDQIHMIRSQPVSSVRSITEDSREVGNEVLGCVVSPDQKALYYTGFSSDRRPGFWRIQKETGVAERLNDKFLGAGLEVIPGTRFIIMSEVHQINQYEQFSDLRVFETRSNEFRWLTHGWRAKDPSVSPDGQHVAFAMNQPGHTVLAIAPLVLSKNSWPQIGVPEIAFAPPLLDRIANPKFSADGRFVYFSYHPNGNAREDLMRYDRNTHKTETVLSDGFFNQYPTRDDAGNLYVVSNANGVNNLYQVILGQDKPAIKMRTNLISSIRLPCFGKNSQLYASVLTTRGWNLSEVSLEQRTELTPARSQVPAPPAPPTLPSQAVPSIIHPIQDYSIYPSILPRAWYPAIHFDNVYGWSLGATVMGFDATDRHRYEAGIGYTPSSSWWNGTITYSNRSLGPAFTFTNKWFVDQFEQNGQVLDFQRSVFRFSAAYPFLEIFSRWEPSLGWTYDFSDSTPPSLDGSVSFTNAEYSPLAISAESGRSLNLISRYFYSLTDPAVKVIATGEEYLRLGKHTVLVPSFKGSWVNRLNYEYLYANSVIAGRNTQRILGTGAPDTFEQLGIRGYPRRKIASQYALIPGLELRAPLARIFRSVSHFAPVFLENLRGSIFVDDAILGDGTVFIHLPVLGTSLTLTSEVGLIPVGITAEVSFGTHSALGGGLDFRMALSIPGIQF